MAGVDDWAVAICPFARQELLPENDTQTSITPTQHIHHTAADNVGVTRLWRYFARADIKLESHFWVAFDGTLVQMIDTEVRADANRYANRRAISTETEDDGDPVGNPWSAEQMETLYDLNVWIHQTHGIPLRLCRNTTDPGLGWHSMWNFTGDPIKQTGTWVTSDWTAARGKTCPGPTRIAQLVDTLLPALNGQTAATTGAAEMMTKDETKLVQALLNAVGIPVGRVDGVLGPKTHAGMNEAVNRYRAGTLKPPAAEPVQVTDSVGVAAREFVQAWHLLEQEAQTR